MIQLFRAEYMQTWTTNVLRALRVLKMDRPDKPGNDGVWYRTYPLYGSSRLIHSGSANAAAWISGL